MGSLLLALVMVAVLATVVYGVVVMLSGDDPGLGVAEPDGRALPLPTNRSLTEADLKAVRFDTVLRGYRMTQVDRALRRTAYDLGYKDEMIAVLEAEVIALREGRLEDAELLRKAREAASDTSAAPMPAVPSAPVPSAPVPSAPVSGGPASGRPSPDPQPPDPQPSDPQPPDPQPEVAPRTGDATRPGLAPDGYEPRHSDPPPAAGVPPVAHVGQAGAERPVAGAGTDQSKVDQLTAGRPATGDGPSAPGDAAPGHTPSTGDGEPARRSTRA